ncbi:AlpA family transcriptional regulator [Geobacter sp. SVR]|uniref:helix-turn-helix transcriptional regulator n=1 Tax=Geobacter sp. SVR TaxID=2495594 RepID=UPI00143F044D|nr:AlpA family phage regulatory protein [Geobacter sp. SVR]BCS54113.1 hypothetical protein GSVR_24210 [Geobacter sp. SVR]GCF87597.1 hypothetical protein GSbR_41970 [Geobacter sp. SVR]
MAVEAEFFTVQEIIVKYKLSESTIYRKEKAGTFPKKVKLSERRVGFRAHEVLAWAAALN